MSQSWHDLHDADRTAARHGVNRWQLDSSVDPLRGSEGLGWAHDVLWPEGERSEARRTGPDPRQPAPGGSAGPSSLSATPEAPSSRAAPSSPTRVSAACA